MSNITNIKHDDATGGWDFRDLPRKTAVMVYCPTGEVSFHHIDEYAGMEYAKKLLTEACDKAIPNCPVSVWRVGDIVTYKNHKGVSAFMNIKCQHDDQWEFNEFAEELVARNNRDPAVLSRLARLRGPLVLLIPHE